MLINKNLATIHAYLCADGYVIKNPLNQKQKYYTLGFRNTNLTLLKDFQAKFEDVFKVKLHLIEGQRCRIGSKKIYEKLTTQFGSFYSWEWRMPKLNKKLIKIWLRAYFDCEGWVFCKTHQNRHIGLDCVNKFGVMQIERSLKQMNIKVIRKYNKKRKIYRLIIYGKENIEKFSHCIGFFHPEKNIKLKQTLNDFIVYTWSFPKNEGQCKKFIFSILSDKLLINKHHNLRIISREKRNLSKLKFYLKKYYTIDSKLYKSYNGLGNIYFQLCINKSSEVIKLINLGVIPNLFKSRRI